MRPSLATHILVAIIAAGWRPAGAQSAPPAEHVAYIGFVHTPIGLFSPFAPPAAVAHDHRWGVSARYAQLPRSDRNNFTTAYAVMAEMSVAGVGTATATAGEYRGKCPDPECTNKLMLGAGLARTIAAVRAVTVALSGEVGWSEQEFDTGYLAARIMAPAALSIPAIRGFHMVAQIAPGVGIVGATVHGSVDEHYSGARPLVGASLALSSTNRAVAVQLDALHTVIDDGATGIGFAVSLRPR